MTFTLKISKRSNYLWQVNGPVDTKNVYFIENINGHNVLQPLSYIAWAYFSISSIGHTVFRTNVILLRVLELILKSNICIKQ